MDVLSHTTHIHQHTYTTHYTIIQEAVKKVMVYIRPEGVPLPEDDEEGASNVCVVIDLIV